MTTGVIDVHAHLFFDELLNAAGELGPRVEAGAEGNVLVSGRHRWPIGTATSLATTPERRLVELDVAGVRAQVLSLSPLWLFHGATAATAVPFAARANDLLAAFCAQAPERLLGVAALPAQEPAAAVEELHRAVEQGLLGAYIGTDAWPALDDPALDELYAACVRLDVPLVVHSTVTGTAGPPGDPRLQRWLGQVLVGYPFEETLAIQALVLGGVLARHPALDVLLPHGGGAFPFLHGRLRSYVASGAAPLSVDDFDEAVGRLWLDTHVHGSDALRLLRSVAPHRLVYGSNFGGWDTGHPADVGDLTDELTTNASQLFRLIGGARR